MLTPRSGAAATFRLAFSLVALLAVLATPSTLYAQEGTGTTRVQLDSAEPFEATAGHIGFDVAGVLEAPQGVVLVASVMFAGERCNSQQIPVGAGGAFSARIGPWDSEVLPGVYTIRVEYLPAAQRRDVASELPEGFAVEPVEREVRVGDAAQEATRRADLRRRLIQIMNQLQVLHGQLGMLGSYTLDGAKWEKVVQGFTLSEDTITRIRRQWDTFTQNTWHQLYHRAQHDFRENAEIVLASYYPRAEQHIDAILLHMRKWYAAYTKAIYEVLGLRVPDEIVGDAEHEPDFHYERTILLASEVYIELGVESPPEWGLIDLARPERPEDVQGEVFRSTVSKFEIARPNEQWLFDLARIHPGTRLRLRLASEVGTDPTRPGVSTVVMGVEISDFPAIDTEQDLDRALEDLSVAKELVTLGRWPGYREVSKREVWAVDPTMRQRDHGRAGYRRGLDVVFTSVAGEQTYQVRQYSLFCRWIKRTYDVVCIAPRDRYAEFEAQFQAVIDTFKVLDDPEVHTGVPEDGIQPPPGGGDGAGGGGGQGAPPSGGTQGAPGSGGGQGGSGGGRRKGHVRLGESGRAAGRWGR